MRKGHPPIRVWHILLASVFALVIFAPGLRAQVDTGTILGTVKDQSGAVVPNANVSLTNEGTGFTISTKTSGEGNYTFTPIKIGTYTVSVEAPGFAKAVHSHLSVSINQQLVVNLSLRPGAVTQTITVTGAPPALQTQSASVGQVVNQRNINNLPLNGRNFTFLAQTVAGVNTPQNDTRGNAASGAFSANGLRPAQNNYLLNGIDNNSDNVDFLNGTNYNVLPPIDALSEFKVQTSDYSAEYGRAGGAILNATIKSGTNKIHGDAWEFLRNDKFDAADFFENAGGVKKGEFRQNQFGFTIGGPITIPHIYDGKNKLFFFADYEGLRRRQGTVYNNSVPTAAERGSGYTNFADLILGQAGSSPMVDALGRQFPLGTILDPATTRPVTAGSVDPVTGITAASDGYVRDPFYGGSITGVTDFTGLCSTAQNCQLNQLPPGRLDQNAIKLLNLYPAPNGPSLFGTNYTDSPVTSENRDALDSRVDFDMSQSNQMFGTFSYVNDPIFLPGPFQGVADGGSFNKGSQSAKSFLAAFSYTHIFSPTTVNEARIGESRLHATRFGPVANTLGIPGQYGISNSVPQVALNGGLPAFSIGGLNTLGSNSFLPSDEITQTTQVTDNLTKIYGNHTFKMGMEYQHVKYATLQPSWSHGQFNYGGYYTGVPEGKTGNTGVAQFLLLPCPGPTPGGTPTGCPTVAGAVPNVGGADDARTSNIALTDQGKDYWGTYFQDNWKFTPKLTLNLGVRWDWFGQTFDHHNAQANLIPGPPGQAQYLIPADRNKGLSASFLAVTAQDGIKIVSSNNRNLGVSQTTNFSPRLGFAYQMTQKLVVRGGYGIFYNGFENRGYSPNIGENYPFQFDFHYGRPNDQTPVGPTFSNFVGTPCANAFMFETGFDCTPIQTSVVNANGLSLRGIQYNYLTPYTQGWNMTVQYELTSGLTAQVAYVGNTVRHLETFPGSNQVSQILPSGTDTHAKSAPGVGRYIPYPDFGQGSSYAATQGNSLYNSLQTSLQQHFANGLDFLATYTYSNARSDSGDLLNGGSQGGYRCQYCPGFGIQGDWQNANYDVRNVFHFSGGYQLPLGSNKAFLNNLSGVGNQIVSGWSTQWIATVEGGQPLNIGCPTGPTSGTGCNSLLTGQDPYAGPHNVNQWLNPAAFAQPCVIGASGPEVGNPAGCVPLTGLGALGGAPAQLRTPGITTFDFSLFKDFRISDRYDLQFRSEFFNILNHPTFNAPGFGGNGVVAISGSTDFTNSNFGKIGGTRFPFNDPRQIQFALKLYF
jgi:Carboxypeptidase regulatory-like domain/TonB dependent receptor-like, beta-barrel/TonB-dependent Receptor Plug Domain